MSESLESILSFLNTNQHNIVNETITSIKFKIDTVVNEIDSSDVANLQNIENLTFSFEYDGNITGAKSIEEFKNLFGNDTNYLKVIKLVSITVNVKKSCLNTNNKFENFYFFSSYTHFKEKFGNVYKKFDWKKSGKKIYIFCFSMDEEMEYQNDFIHLLLFDKFSIISEKDIRLEALKKFNVFKERNENKTVNSLFNYPLTWIDSEGKSPMFFMNHSLNLFFESVSIEAFDTNRVLIKGYKNIYFEKNLIEGIDGEIKEGVIFTFKLLTFLIDEDKFYDKLLIIRNNITLYLNTNSSIKDYLEKAKEIYKTVTHNFDLYIQNEIKVFLEQKNALLHEFISVSKQLGEIINDLTAQLRNVGASLLGTFFIGLVSDFNTEFSIPGINLILLSYSIFFIINFGITFSHSKQFKNTKSLLENYTRTISVNNEELSYKNLEEQYLKEPSINFNCIVSSTRFFLICLIIIFLGCYISINFGIFTCITDAIKFLLNPSIS